MLFIKALIFFNTTMPLLAIYVSAITVRYSLHVLRYTGIAQILGISDRVLSLKRGCIRKPVLSKWTGFVSLQQNDVNHPIFAILWEGS